MFTCNVVGSKPWLIDRGWKRQMVGTLSEAILWFGYREVCREQRSLFIDGRGPVGGRFALVAPSWDSGKMLVVFSEMMPVSLMAERQRDEMRGRVNGPGEMVFLDEGNPEETSFHHTIWNRLVATPPEIYAFKPTPAR